MTKVYLVYAHISPSNKAYIGITGRNTSKRWGPTGLGYKSQPKFYRAIQKYGWEHFEHKILFETTSLEEAYSKEKYFIKEYNSFYNGYNSDFGGAGAEGHIVSPESRKIMSKRKLGKSNTWKGQKRPELTVKIFVYNLDKTLFKTFQGYTEASIALKVNISTLRNAANYGQVIADKYLITNEKTNNLVDAFFERYTTTVSIPSVFLYDYNGNLLGSYKTYQDASNATGISVGNIGKCCIGLTLRTTKGIFLKPNDNIDIRLRAISKELPPPMIRKRAKVLKVLQFDASTDALLAEFSSYQQAADVLGLPKARITANCNGHIKRIDNFYFKKIIEN